MSSSSSEAILDVIDAPMQALDTDHFIRHYWQKKPLLLRGAFENFSNPLSADELAELAMHEDTESRIVRQLDTEPYWAIEHGPFSEQQLAGIPDTHWTLLVQDVDKHLPDLAPFLDHFAFLPAWRIDDLMISAAGDGGSVGPHRDSYDVFLLQATGKREWQLSSGSDAALLPGLEFGVLANFTADETVLLEPGDMLYLPPEIAHHGVAQGDCMTWSIGFRAPDLAAILPDFMEWQLALQGSKRYADPDLDPAEALNGQLSTAALNRAQQLVQSAMETDPTRFARWFGCHVTEPKHWLRTALPGERLTAGALVERLSEGLQLERNSLSRLTYSVHDSKLYLYFDGQDREMDPKYESLLAMLCTQRVLPAASIPGLDDKMVSGLLADLYNQGCLQLMETGNA